MALATLDTTSWHTASTEPWFPPGVSFCNHAKVEPERRSTNPALGPYGSLEAIIQSRFGWQPQRPSRFLSLPLEVRMHIYEWAHLMNTPPAMKAASSPYPMPTPRRCFLKPVHDDDEPSTSASTSKSPAELLHSDRPTSGLPTSLLLVCKQVYDEARLIPTRNNEFTFVNWFSSGLWSAHFFVQAMQPWQWATMRYARLEMLAAELGDLGDNGESLRRWSRLCDKWAHGLRGLRLRIIGSRGLGIMPVKPIIPIINRPRDGSETNEEDRRIRELFADDVGRCTWVTKGLAKLWALQRLELDMVLPRWSAQEKLAWCRRLQEVLREGGMRTTVVCVERVSEGEWEAAMQTDVAREKE